MTGRCLICRQDYSTLEEHAEHELRHRVEADERRRAYLERELADRSRRTRAFYAKKRKAS